MEREWAIIVSMFTVTVVMAAMVNGLGLPILCNYELANCPVKTAMDKATDLNFWDTNAARHVFDMNSDEATLDEPTTPPGFIGMLTGLWTGLSNFVTSLPIISEIWKAAGVFGHMAMALVGFLGAFQFLALYYITQPGMPAAFATLIGLFVTAFTVMQGIAAFYFVMYVVGIIRGAK